MLLFATIAALAAVLLGFAAILRKRRAIASRAFLAGMILLGAEAWLNAAVLRQGETPGTTPTVLGLFLVKSLVPGAWLAFSLTYSRGRPVRFLRQWRFVLLAGALLPPGIAVLGAMALSRSAAGEEGSLLLQGNAFKIFCAVSLVFSVFILVNLEKTFRAAAGLERWRSKFLFLGVAGIFGARIYTHSQALLYSRFDPALGSLESGALLIGCVFMALAYRREAFSSLNLHPSREILQGSITVIFAGIYFIVIGILAQFVGQTGAAKILPAQAFLILVGLSGLGAFFLSDRSALFLRGFVSRHFRRPQHDARRIWSHFTADTAAILERPALCREFVKLLSETFDALSVTLLLWKDSDRRLQVAASTNDSPGFEIRGGDFGEGARAFPFDLETAGESWAEALRESLPNQFERGGIRLGVPLTAGERTIGLAVLGDRVNGVRYRQEEWELLQCIGGHIGTAILNRELNEKLTRAAQFEALQTMAAFVSHDLKNAGNHLGLMLANLPVHFDKPAFREDALRSISGTVDHINRLVGRLNEFRSTFEIASRESDLNEFLAGLTAEFGKEGGFEFEEHFGDIPPIPFDDEKLGSVMGNLFRNAREATPEESCRIELRTSLSEEFVAIAVRDSGAGMDESFVAESLFRPFCSTKSRGFGIGMYQAKLIVEAHGGRVEVDSEPGIGTTVTVFLPLEERAADHRPDPVDGDGSRGGKRRPVLFRATASKG